MDQEKPKILWKNYRVNELLERPNIFTDQIVITWYTKCSDLDNQFVTFTNWNKKHAITYESFGSKGDLPSSTLAAPLPMTDTQTVRGPAGPIPAVHLISVSVALDTAHVMLPIFTTLFSFVAPSNPVPVTVTSTPAAPGRNVKKQCFCYEPLQVEHEHFNLIMFCNRPRIMHAFHIYHKIVPLWSNFHAYIQQVKIRPSLCLNKPDYW